MNNIKDYIVTIPDFPKPGIQFRDVTSLIRNPEGFRLAVDALEEALKDVEFDAFAALESRGFIFASPLADRMGKGIILVRKKGKLPRETISESYALEYGTATVEIHREDVTEGERIVVVDDLIATGGSAMAAVKLVERLGGKVVKCQFLIELPALNGRAFLKDYEVGSIVSFEGD